MPWTLSPGPRGRTSLVSHRCSVVFFFQLSSSCVSFLWGTVDITVLFQMCNVRIWGLYPLHNDHNKSGWRSSPSPHTVPLLSPLDEDFHDPVVGTCRGLNCSQCTVRGSLGPTLCSSDPLRPCCPAPTSAATCLLSVFPSSLTFRLVWWRKWLFAH